ncbi:hypothetical protein ABZ464_33875 [Streptomyces sp. NPDC005820]|uniref:hypothetical protein n=1 Tax=Streptomyces sp. NPDC005820 TaxID=3157069 RepID=UPI0033ED8557
MGVVELTGTYTYRSFLNRPEPVDDFNKLRFAQLELRLAVDPDGAISGELVFPEEPGADPLAMDGPIADFHYEYDGIVLRHWETGIGQRMTLAGTVLRAEDHGSGPTLAKAGQTAGFLAVKREA